MKSRQDHIDELRIKIKNYKITRKSAKGAIVAWCDALITSAEAELAQLTDESDSLDQGDSFGDSYCRQSTNPGEHTDRAGWSQT